MSIPKACRWRMEARRWVLYESEGYMKTKEFSGTCVENPFGRIETLVKVIDNAIEITKQTFFKHCILSAELVAEIRLYPNDYRFYKYKSIYFYTWSAIEHFYK